MTYFVLFFPMSDSVSFISVTGISHAAAWCEYISLWWPAVTLFLFCLQEDLTTKNQLSEIVISHQADSHPAIFLRSAPQEDPQLSYLFSSEPQYCLQHISLTSIKPDPSGQPLVNCYFAGMLQALVVVPFLYQDTCQSFWTCFCK